MLGRINLNAPREALQRLWPLFAVHVGTAIREPAIWKQGVDSQGQFEVGVGLLPVLSR